ncbi:hypothetical protein E2562_034119 [Oryza meyeriana var. granulata]|uniref:Uncharacterized protein n=1 Tax=Oryza meyeriana var. granulata TaxID=110450 RepID=A0A6G1E664_9ORYZ|nr:hypothetical protein E2562_034119 [Oryza meyeriana var. granulata]
MGQILIWRGFGNAKFSGSDGAKSKVDEDRDDVRGNEFMVSCMNNQVLPNMEVMRSIAGIKRTSVLLVNCIHIVPTSQAEAMVNVGNWSRWLQDKFDMAAAALEKGGQAGDDSDHRRDAADSSSFKLLNELGDLLMLPTDMLLGNIMKEVGLPFYWPSTDSKSATSPLTSSVLNKFLEWF